MLRTVPPKKESAPLRSCGASPQVKRGNGLGNEACSTPAQSPDEPTLRISSRWDDAGAFRSGVYRTGYCSGPLAVQPATDPGAGMSSMEHSQRHSAGSGAGPKPRDLSAPRDRWLRIGPESVMTFPLAGQPGHGRTASVRRQPVRIVDGRMEGDYTDAFELICPSCGDHPYLDYSEVPPQLQQLRGPYTLQAALTAYDKHLGPCPGPCA